VFEELAAYLRRHPVGFALTSPADISWSADTLVQPDVFVADLAEVRALDWSRVKRLLLAVEVLSPTTSRYDRFTKRRLYQDVGVPVYWVVHPDRKVVEVWTPNDVKPVMHDDCVVWSPAGAAEPLRISLAELFRAI
jgi:Uma2 family endonuclease